MKSRYFIRLSFLGTRYQGWQKQKNGPSVQAALSDALSVVGREMVDVTGAGRTDSGVHAREFYAHFDGRPMCKKERDEMVFHLNGYLPYDIAVQQIIPVVSEAHARFSAVSRTYEYVITTRKNPFLEGLAYFYPGFLDIGKMNKGTDVLKLNDDFTSFSKLPSDAKTNICRITEIYWEQKGDLLVFSITANRFLRNMVRAIVGTLLDLGRGKIEIPDLHEIIRKRDRRTAGYSVPACGLYLTKVIYPGEIFLNDSEPIQMY